MAENGNVKKSTPEEEDPRRAFGWAARDSSGILSPFSFSRRNNGDEDITLKILFCGVCHSDLHGIKNEYGISRYPLVPGCKKMKETKVPNQMIGEKCYPACRTEYRNYAT